jgi:hypothetical protein
VTENGGYAFTSVRETFEALAALGVTIKKPECPDARRCRLSAKPGGKLIVELERLAGEGVLAGFDSDRKRHTFIAQHAETASDIDTMAIDNVVRVVITPQGESVGAFIRNGAQWVAHPLSLATKAIRALGNTAGAADLLIGHAVLKPWIKVNLPFQPEFLGDRRWNLGAAQFAFPPAEEAGDTPYWDRVLIHIGTGLDKALSRQDWAGVANGGDYLKLWLAAMIREPFEPLPYLFLYGPENSGKSILWEGFALLLTSGVVKADRALTSTSDFNGELANAILCVVEETNVAKSKRCLGKIKDAVTTKTLAIRKMRTDTYTQPNTTHWMQTSNEMDACPIFPGDSRITMIEVGPVGEEIPKGRLLDELKREGPAFLRALLDVDLPEAAGRLRIPIIETAAKRIVQDHNRNPVDEFVRNHCHEVDGARIKLSEFYERFYAWLPVELRGDWGKHRVSRALPFPVGKSGSNTWIGNLSFENSASGTPYYVDQKGALQK